MTKVGPGIGLRRHVPTRLLRISDAQASRTLPKRVEGHLDVRDLDPGN